MSAAQHVATPTALDEKVALQAAEWFFLFKSGEASADDHRRWTLWCAAHPAHATAWQRAQQVGQKFDGLPGALAMPVLTRPVHEDRRAAAKALAVLLVAAPTGWWAWRHSQAPLWLADHHTATGERRALQLADGSRLMLDTASAIDVKFDSYQRMVHLRYGAISIETAPDTAPQHRPLVVETPHGRLRALGTRFVVRLQGERSHLAVLEGAVEVRPSHANAPAVIVRAGQQTTFSAPSVDAPEAIGPHADAWTRGVLQARNMRLQDFAAELARYRPGVLHCDPAVADLRISGAFQLRDTTPVLDSLPQALPVDVLYRTRYWVTLLPPGG